MLGSPAVDGSSPSGVEVEWRRLTVDELGERFAAGAVALWPIGATEQHGPHAVTGFDHLAAEAIVLRAARILGTGAVVLPTLPVGCSRHWVELGGTLTLSHPTLFAVLRET